MAKCLLCVFVSQYSNKVDFISTDDAQMGDGPRLGALVPLPSLWSHHCTTHNQMVMMLCHSPSQCSRDMSAGTDAVQCPAGLITTRTASSSEPSTTSAPAAAAAAAIQKYTNCLHRILPKTALGFNPLKCSSVSDSYT